MTDATDRLAKGHGYVQRLLADEAVPVAMRTMYRAMYEAMASKAGVEDLLWLARRLDALKTGAAT